LNLREDFGVALNPGETIAAINYGGKAMKVPLYALLGLQRKELLSYCLLSLNDGDGLISWQGQRVHPALSCSGGQCTDQPITNLQGFLQGNNSIFESQVSELILGAIDEPDSDKRPGSSVSSFTGYGHGKATITCLSDERQTVIKRDRHANPDRHDVLIAVKRILDGGGSSPSTAPLNDTGISWCANDTTNNLPCPVASHRGQDGEHGRDALARAGQLQKVGGGNAGFDFTKLDANGNTLPASATSWACVRDNHTGLIWEVKTTSGLRSMNNKYTWYDPKSPDGNPGTANGGICTGSACDTTGFVQAVNQQGLCGASDWRMPTRRELQGIVDYGRFNPAIDTGYFLNTPSSRFWSASPGSYSSDFAPNVDFFIGEANGLHRSNGGLVRLVRGGP
jgi:hypothetical protein